MPRSNQATESRTARLTILIDPRKKKIFEEICAAQDLTPSQVVRKLIRQYVIDNAAGRPLPEWLTAQSARDENEKKSAVIR
jgi:Ribbon-helix-helix protein